MFEWFLTAYVLLWGWENSSSRVLTRAWKLFGECRFCAGVWVFFVLTPLFQPRMFLSVYVPVVSDFLAAVVASFVLYWIVEGFNTHKVIHYG